MKHEPGIPFQDVRRRLDTPQTTAYWLLQQLVDLRILDVRKQNGFASYFVAGDRDRSEMAGATVLRTRGSRRVFAGALAAPPGVTPLELAARVGMSETGVRHHLKRFLREGLLRAEVQEGETRLFVTKLGEAQRGAAAG